LADGSKKTFNRHNLGLAKKIAVGYFFPIYLRKYLSEKLIYVVRNEITYNLRNTAGVTVLNRGNPTQGNQLLLSDFNTIHIVYVSRVG
jgi:hypothetical protein